MLICIYIYTCCVRVNICMCSRIHVYPNFGVQVIPFFYKKSTLYFAM